MIFISAGAVRVLRIPYKKKNLWLCRGGTSLKKNSFGREKNPTAKKGTFSEPKTKSKEKSFPFPFQFSSVQNQTQIKSKVSFSSHFLLKTAFKSNKRLQSQFSRQNYISKRWTPSEGRINTASTSIFYSFLCLFIILFNLLLI